MHIIEKKSDCNKFYYWPSAICIYMDAIWFVYGRIATLCKSDITGSKTVVVAELPCDNPLQSDLYYRIMPINRKLFFIPYWGDRILIYDIDKEIFSQITFLESEEGYFQNAFFEGEDIICLPAKSKYIYRVNTDEYTIEKEVFIDAYLKKINDNCFNDSDRINDKLYYLVDAETNWIYQYDSRNREFSSFCLGSEERKYSSVVAVDDELLICSCETQEIVRYSTYFHKEIGTWWPKGLCNIALRKVGENIIIDDKNSACMEIYDTNYTKQDEYNPPIIVDRSMYYDFLTGKPLDNDVHNAYFCNADASLVFINGGQIDRVVKLEIEKGDLNLLRELYWSKVRKHIVAESDFFGLDSFVKLV